MKILDKLAQKLALRWLKGKVEKARKEGSKGMKALDGWQAAIVVVGLVAAKVVGLVTGADVGELLTTVFNSIGWGDPETVARAKGFATIVAPILVGVWAMWAEAKTAWKQYRAGAKPAELMSTEGYVKQAQAEAGVIPTGDVTIPPKEERRETPR